MSEITLHIPREEARDAIMLLDAIKTRLTKQMPNLAHDVFVIGPERGISFRVVHWSEKDRHLDFPDDEILVEISYDGIEPKI